MTDEASFTLDPRLAQESVALGDLPLSRVLLVNDANDPWLILVPRRPNLVELIDLDDSGQATLMIEIARAARALKDITACDKLNVAALGNTVRQLHVHVIARHANDPAGSRPVWGAVPARPYTAAERDASPAHCAERSGSADSLHQGCRLAPHRAREDRAHARSDRFHRSAMRRPHRRGGGARDDAAGRAAR
jgi:diadenosine tetraphosphate (Ap4A) HIT family hydrolase